MKLLYVRVSTGLLLLAALQLQLTSCAKGDGILHAGRGRQRRRGVREATTSLYEDGVEGERRERRRRELAKVVYDVGLPPGYNKHVIPKAPNGGALPLYIFVNVVNILDWDELDELLHLDLELSVMWTDYAIMYHHNQSTLHNHLPAIDNLTPEQVRAKRITVNNYSILDDVWRPNLFIENLLSITQPTLMVKPVTVKFIPEVGWFEYNTRIIVKMDCEMDFLKYPADTQECEFSIRGFSYPKKDLSLNWFKNGAFLNDLTLPSFDVVIKSTDKEELRLHKHMEDPDDVFEVLHFVIAARRKLSYHFVQTYLASTFYIIITTLCFLLPARMIEARIGISMTTLLTLTAMFASVRESTPIVSYVKAIDIWMVGCVFFVFLVLAQFTISTWITGGNVIEEEGPPGNRQTSLVGRVEEGNEVHEKGRMEMAGLNLREPTLKQFKGMPLVFVKRSLSVLEKYAATTERFSFPIFLAIFAIYTFIYWTWLLVTSEYFNWSVNGTLNDIVDFSDD